MAFTKLRSFCLSLIVGMFVFLAYFLLFLGLTEESAVFRGNGGAIIAVFGMAFFLVIFHLFAHVGFTAYSVSVFKGKFQLSSFLIKPNDGAISVFKVCTYVLAFGYLCAACYFFFTQKPHLLFYGLFLLTAIVVTVLYTSWLTSILYERRKKRFCKVDSSENPQFAFLLYQQDRIHNFGIVAIVLSAIGLIVNFLPLAPIGLTVAITGCRNAKKNNLKSSSCTVGLVLSILSCIWYSLYIFLFILRFYSMV